MESAAGRVVVIERSQGLLAFQRRAGLQQRANGAAAEGCLLGESITSRSSKTSESETVHSRVICLLFPNTYRIVHNAF